MKGVQWIGSALSDLREFPDAAKQDCGFQIDRVQRGLDPRDWKPMPSVGAGCREIRVRDEGRAFRVMYVASFGDRVYVLHAFEKKSQRTARRDIEVGRWRYEVARRLAKQEKG